MAGDARRFCDAANAVSEILQRVNRNDLASSGTPQMPLGRTAKRHFLSPEMEAHLRHVHLKDLKRQCRGTANYVLTGEGEFPFDTMFAALEGVRYEGFLSFEWEKHWHPELAPPEVALPHFMEWWKGREVDACLAPFER